LPEDFLSQSSKIKEVIKTAKSQQLIFYRRKKNKHSSSGYKAYNFELDNKDTNINIKNIVIDSIDLNKNFKIKPYSININICENDCVYELPAKDVFNFKKIQEAMLINNIGRANIANLKEDNPNFYILNFEHEDEQVIALVQHNPTTVFKEKLFINRGIIFDSCISIKKNIDCLYYKIKTNENDFVEKIVIFNKKKPQFETIFDYKIAYEEFAYKALNKIKENNLLTNIDIFESISLKDELFIKKLAKIHLEEKIKIVKENFKRAEKVNKEFEELKVVIDSKNQSIVIPQNADKEYIRKVLSILNCEPMQNIISQEKMLISDNSKPVQQKFLLF